MIDYQWPSFKPAPFKRSLKKAAAYHPIIKEVEKFYSKQMGCSAILVPSARAGISLILKYHEVGRQDVVFAPKWSSHCVWEAIGRVSNPTISLNSASDVLLAVHKWGVVGRAPRNFKGLIIEDSVDSVFTNPDTFFPNKGRYELISLPKTIGSSVGGIILVRDPNDAKGLRKLMGGDEVLARQQTFLKFAERRGDGAAALLWQAQEHKNFTLDANALLDIKAASHNFVMNKLIIRRRLAQLLQDKKTARFVRISEGRLPPVIGVPVKKLRCAPLGLIVRHRNESEFFDKPDFQKVVLLPLHFGISNRDFSHCFNLLKASIL